MTRKQVLDSLLTLMDSACKARSPEEIFLEMMYRAVENEHVDPLGAITRTNDYLDKLESQLPRLGPALG